MKKSKVIKFSESTYLLLTNLSKDIKNLQDTINAIISTVIAEKGNPKIKYSLSPDNKSLIPIKEEKKNERDPQGD